MKIVTRSDLSAAERRLSVIAADLEKKAAQFERLKVKGGR